MGVPQLSDSNNLSEPGPAELLYTLCLLLIYCPILFLLLEPPIPMSRFNSRQAVDYR